MRKARGAVCADAAKARSASARARSTPRKVFTSSLHEGPVADVEILAHSHVHEAAHVAQRARDVARAPYVLGEDEVSRQAQGAVAVARLELEDPRCQENQLAPGILELEASDGHRTLCLPGDLIFAEDVRGTGHITRSLRDVRGFVHVAVREDFDVSNWPLVEA